MVTKTCRLFPQAVYVMRRTLPGARGALVPGAGHFWNLEFADLFTQTLRAWIEDKPLYVLCRIDAQAEMTGKQYALAFAGLFARQTNRPMTAGKLKTDSLLFASVIVGTALIVVALTYLPAAALGPMIEHLRMVSG